MDVGDRRIARDLRPLLRPLLHPPPWPPLRFLLQRLIYDERVTRESRHAECRGEQGDLIDLDVALGLQDAHEGALRYAGGRFVVPRALKFL